jgi:hypothetical protein
MENFLKKFMNEYKHLQHFYKTKKEFKQHLLSGEVKISIPNMINLKTNKIMKQTKKQKQEKFEEAVRPLMKYLAENHHPHTSIYVTSRTAELLEGQKCLSTNEYIVD